MENNFVIKENEHDNCLFGYIGAIIGAFIVAALWYFIYQKFEFDLVILFGFIPFGALKGYQFFKGIVNKNTTATVSIVSIIVAIGVATYANEQFGIEFIAEQNMQIYIIFMVIGLIFTLNKITRILNEYKAANNLIKDTDDFALRPDSPIIEKNGGLTNNFQDSYKKNIQTRPTSKLNVSSPSNNRYNMNKAYKTSNYTVGKIIFFVYIVTFIIIFSVIAIFCATDIDNENDYSYSNFDSSAVQYTLPNGLLKLDIPTTWDYEVYGYSITEFTDSDTGSTSLLHSYNKSYYDYEDFDEFFDNSMTEFKDEYDIDFSLNKQFIYLNGYDAYRISTSIYDSEYGGYLTYYLYGLETENFYVDFICVTDLNTSYEFSNKIENVLRTINEDI